MTTIAIASGALFIALIGLFLTLIQFLTSHRPFVFVNSMDKIYPIDDDPSPFLKISIVNLGQTPARNVEITATLRSQFGGQESQTHNDKLGAVFPNQVVTYIFDIEKYQAYFNSGLQTISVTVYLGYQGPLTMRLKPFTIGSHHTKQPLYFGALGDWGPSSEGVAEYN